MCLADYHCLWDYSAYFTGNCQSLVCVNVSACRHCAIRLKIFGASTCQSERGKVHLFWGKGVAHKTRTVSKVIYDAGSTLNTWIYTKIVPCFSATSCHSMLITWKIVICSGHSHSYTCTFVRETRMCITISMFPIPFRRYILFMVGGRVGVTCELDAELPPRVGEIWTGHNLRVITSYAV